jgi:trehalose/maltose hydrolase-like predicted phosphorylase
MKRMHLHLRYRGHTLEVDIEPGRLQIRTVRSNAKPILVSFRDEVCELRMDRPHEFVW